MTIVVDASVAVKWVLPEDGSDSAFALRAQSLIAPPLWLVEAANALWRYVQTARLASDEAPILLRKLSTAPVTSVSEPDDLTSAFQIAQQLRHPVYDCLYLALAIRQDTHVITADRRFLTACARDRSLKQRVRLLDGI